MYYSIYFGLNLRLKNIFHPVFKYMFLRTAQLDIIFRIYWLTKNENFKL